MDPATIVAVGGMVGKALVTLGASANVMQYWKLVEAQLPAAVNIAEDVASFIVDRVYPVIKMAKERRDPTDEEWTALNESLVRNLGRLNALASQTARV